MEDFSYINGEGTALRMAQKEMLQILIEFDRICRKNNLTYWIDYGTLLGAVRHSGFIPWDDDIDVSMPSSDYKHFLEVASSELKEGFFLQNQQTEPQLNMGVGISKIRKDGTLFINDFDNFRIRYHKGISIDVFEVVDYPNVSPKTWNFFRKRVFKSYGFFHYNPSLTLKNIISYFVFPVEYVLFKGLWSLLCLGRKKERTLSRLERTPYGYPTMKTEIYPLQEMTFEGFSFFAPQNPSARLRDNFGDDFMQIPPSERRRIHAKFICTDTSKQFINQ